MGRNELKGRQRILSKANAEWNNRIKNRTLFGKEWQRVSACEHGKPHELTAALVKLSITYYVENLNFLDRLKKT